MMTAKHFKEADLRGLEKYYRANLINSVSGYKPANLIATISSAGETNLAVFSSVVHLGADPALLGFVVRPSSVPRHTYENILATKVYTINHIHESFVEQAHCTSAKFPRAISEFSACQLEPEYLDGFAAPFVKESQVKIGMRFLEEIPIKSNNTILVVGKIEHLILPAEIIVSDGQAQLEKVHDVCISGLESYHSVTQFKKFSYARVENLPKF